MIKKLLSASLTAITAAAIAASAAYAYYDASAELASVNESIKYGSYLEAAALCDSMLREHELSDEDIEYFTFLRGKALDRYSAYLNGTLSFYNAFEEIRQIKQDMNYRPDKALENCRNTLAWHELSPADTILLERYMAKAEVRAGHVDRYGYFDEWNRDGFDDPAPALRKILAYIRDGKYSDAIQLCSERIDSVTVYPIDESLYYRLCDRAEHAQRAAGKSKISSSQAISIMKRNDNYTAQEIAFGAPAYKATDLGDCYWVQGWTTKNANGSWSSFVFNDGSLCYAIDGSDPAYGFTKNGVILHGYPVIRETGYIYAE